MSATAKWATAPCQSKRRSTGFTELEKMIADSPSPERVCLKLSQILRVERNEIALLRLEKGSLRFVYPARTALRRV